MDAIPDHEKKCMDSAYFTESFEDGPLGLVFHRDKTLEFVFVKEIINGSQASNTDINVNDRVWAVDDVIFGTNHINKETWSDMLDYIKVTPRPIKICFRRIQL